jgi:hypothetical protein
MPASNAMFEYHYVYGNPKLHYIIADIYGKYSITPVTNNRGDTAYYEVNEFNTPYSEIKFRSQKKAMQYVVAELFTEFFDYEHYGFTRHTRIHI